MAVRLLSNHIIRKWVRSPEWFVGFLILLTLASLTFLLNMLFSVVSPGNAWGLTYGTIAALLMGGAALYGVRRRKPRLHAGRSHTWVQFHVYGGTIFLLLVLMHSGFQVPSGGVTWWLWFLSIWITASGLLGVALQKWIPRILTSGLTVEVVYERIPDLVSQIRDRAEGVALAATDPVRDFYQKKVAASLVAPQTRLIYYFDITGGGHSRARQFEYLRRVLSSDDRKNLDRIESIYKTKLELDAHYTLQKALRWWLYTHVPVSLILIVLLAVHLYSVFYY